MQAHQKWSAFLDLLQEERRGLRSEGTVAQWEKHYLTLSVGFDKVTPSTQRTNRPTVGRGGGSWTQPPLAHFLN